MIIVLLPIEQNLKISKRLKADEKFGTKIFPFHQIRFENIQNDSLTLLDIKAAKTLQNSSNLYA